MKARLSRLLLTVAIAVTAALPLAAGMAQEAGGSTGSDVVEPVVWTLAALAAGTLILGVFQLLKRQLGLFENPEWVAPIEAMYSEDLPQDEPGEH